MKVTTTQTYVYNGQILLPGEHDASPEMLADLRRIGAVPPAPESERENESGRTAMPAGAVAGFFVPASAGFDPTNVRLGSGNVPTPAPQGVTPGDPVQRAAAPIGNTEPMSAIERHTADPALNMPPPVVHSSEGEPQTPESAGDGSEADGDDPGSDDGDDGDPDATGDDGTDGESDPGADTSETPGTGSAEAETPARRGGRVVSRPRSTAE